MPKIELLDEPPVRDYSKNYEKQDEVILVLIDNPGKWALIETRRNPKYRVTTSLRARYGKAFTFRTTLNGDTGLIEVWGSYKEGEQ